jgi:hypothetical protein
MRFNGADWLRLILACIMASAAMAVLSWAVWSAISFPRSLYVAREVALGLSLLVIPLNALAAWPALRGCVSDLELAPWLTETALGALLGAIVSVPTLVSLVLDPNGTFPTATAIVPNGVGWLPPIASAVAALFPLGLLLQRMSGASAWPSLVIVAAAMAAIALGWSQSPTQFLLPYAMLVTTFFPAQLWLGTMAVAVVMSGVLSGLTLGAGLFLMARARVRTET